MDASEGVEGTFEVLKNGMENEKRLEHEAYLERIDKIKEAVEGWNFLNVKEKAKNLPENIVFGKFSKKYFLKFFSKIFLSSEKMNIQSKVQSSA